MERIYLDANATAPLDPRVRAVMEPYLGCGNASSLHAEGRAAREAIEVARDEVAGLVGATPKEIVFTAGGTEGNALALLGAASTVSGIVACTAVEHVSVLRALQNLDGDRLRILPVGADGRVAPDVPVPQGAALVSVMLVNNETGALQPVREIARRARGLGSLVHCDAIQAAGRVPVDVGDLSVDLLTLSSHKMHGPKGAGALYVRSDLQLTPLFRGGEHERGLRPGTENVAAIAGLGEAARLAREEREGRSLLWGELSRRMLASIHAAVPDVVVRSPEQRALNTLSLQIRGAPAEAVLAGLDLAGFAVSTGSACSSGAAEVSHVLLAMGLNRREAAETIRVSMHAETRVEHVDAFVNTLSRLVKKLRALHV